MSKDAGLVTWHRGFYSRPTKPFIISIISVDSAILVLNECECQCVRLYGSWRVTNAARGAITTWWLPATASRLRDLICQHWDVTFQFTFTCWPLCRLNTFLAIPSACMTKGHYHKGDQAARRPPNDVLNLWSPICNDSGWGTWESGMGSSDSPPMSFY